MKRSEPDLATRAEPAATLGALPLGALILRLLQVNDSVRLDALACTDRSPPLDKDISFADISIK